MGPSHKLVLVDALLAACLLQGVDRRFWMSVVSKILVSSRIRRAVLASLQAMSRPVWLCDTRPKNKLVSHCKRAKIDK